MPAEMQSDGETFSAEMWEWFGVADDDGVVQAAALHNMWAALAVGTGAAVPPPPPPRCAVDPAPAASRTLTGTSMRAFHGSSGTILWKLPPTMTKHSPGDSGCQGLCSTESATPCLSDQRLFVRKTDLES
jgi:hypothetical protein